MSWVVEQSDNTSAVAVNGNTVACAKEGYYGSPINVLYKDAANQNGQYYWIVEVPQLDTDSGSVSVGLTTDQGFKAGWALKGMSYLGNLSDGGALLVSSFGERIKSGDKVGLLLQLTDGDLKFYIFLNNQPLGLAFNVQAPYPKPLYPCKTINQIDEDYFFFFFFLVVSFSGNGQVNITRSQQIPTALTRNAAQFTGIEGNWKITNNSANPETVGVQLEIKQREPNTYGLHAKVLNNLNGAIQYDPSTQQYRSTAMMTTLMGGPPEVMQKERVVSQLLSGLTDLKTQGDQQLILQTSNGQQVQLERYVVPAPSPVTKNIFN